MSNSLQPQGLPGILQARIQEGVAFAFSRGSSQPRDRAQVSCVAGGFFTSWATGEAHQMSNKGLINHNVHYISSDTPFIIKQNLTVSPLESKDELKFPFHQ